MEINFDKDEIINSITDLYTGENRYVVWGVSALLVATLVVLFIVSVSPKKDKALKNQDTVLVVDEDVLIPEGPQTQVTSVTSRDGHNKWGEAEEKRFLTVPTPKELDDLSDANDFLIKDIMGAAP